MLQHSVTAQKVVQLPLTFFKVTFWRIKLQKGRQKWPETMDALCNITLRGGGGQMRTWQPNYRYISRLHTRITRVKETNIKRKSNMMFHANVYHTLALERPLTQLIKALRLNK